MYVFARHSVADDDHGSEAGIDGLHFVGHAPHANSAFIPLFNYPDYQSRWKGGLMIVTLFNLSREHSLLLVGAALLICLVSAWLMLALLDLARTAVPRVRVQWMASTAIVAGLGVWATHFIATLGLRVDYALSFNASVTVLSAVAGVACIGIPIAVTAMAGKGAVRASCGAASGAGIAIMHVTGMAAATNCVIGSPFAQTALITLLGSGIMTSAFSLRPGSHRVIQIALVALAVCIVHFGLIAVSSIDTHLQVRLGVDGSSLGLLVGLVTLLLCMVTAYVVRARAKLSEQTRQQTLLSTALTNMSNGLVLIGVDGRIQLFNDRLLTIFALNPGAIAVGMPWQQYLSNYGSVLGWSKERLMRVIANHRRWFSLNEVTYLEHELDDGRTISVACRPIGSGGAVLTYDDITAERHAQKEVEQLAFHDSLTGLPNRRMFQNTLERVCQAQSTAFLLLIDLDNFKQVNDTLGHAAGDALLMEVGRRLSQLCDHRDHVARIAGDEFAVIMSSGEDHQAAALCRRIINDLGAPFSLMGRTVMVGCSIGSASTLDTQTPALLVQYADLALYRAKETGRRQHRRYEVGMQEVAVRRGQIETDLREALAGDQFGLAYQPIYRLDPGSGYRQSSVMGFEALIRWRHPVRGDVSPADFIPVAEETGLICEIGQWIMREACKQAARWPDHLHVAINVSPVQLRDSELPAQLATLLAEYGLSASQVEVELTETALVNDIEHIAVALRTLRTMGIRIAMDDFGTGYSSFTHLRDFNLDWIKIDRSFVRLAPSDTGARAVLEAIVFLARELGVGTIGEGVETEEQFAILARCGCDAVQGFLLSHPLDASAAFEVSRQLIRGPAWANAQKLVAAAG